MKNTLYMKKNVLLKSGLALLMSVAGFCANAALTEVNQKFSGNYDVKMVSSVVLQPVWVGTTASDPKNVSSFTVEGFISETDMASAGQCLSLNNNYDSGDDWSAKSNYVASIKPANAKFNMMVYADCDDDMNTFQSSAAFLDFGNNMGCTTIEAAYLYWAGACDGSVTYPSYPGTPTMKSYSGGLVGVVDNSNYKSVKFKAPGMADYVTLDPTKTRVVLPKDGSYMCMSDVTEYVKGRTGGLFWVADVRSASTAGSGGAKAGWSLIVVFRYPNCPQRVIKFWDANGTEATGNGSTITMNFDAGEVPASGNAVSYLGFIGLDAEDTPALLLDKDDKLKKGAENFATPEEAGEYLKGIVAKNALKFNGGNGEKTIQPFTDGQQQPTPACGTSSYCIENGYWGVASSQITTYDSETGLNGNQISRLPNQRNTLGYDAHHFRLPSGSMAGGARSATLNLPNEQNGDWSVCATYMAIETQQAILLMDKKSVETSTKPDGEITYELTVKNVGTKASIGTSEVRDTLDKTLDFVPGSVKFFDKNGAEIQTGSFNIINQGADVDEALTFTIPSIAAGDGANANDWITIQFKAKVKGLDRTDIWAYGCNRQVKNKAVVIYKNDAGADVRTGSNSSGGCDGESVYFYTPVVDEDLEKSYLASHHDTLDLSQEPNAANMSVLPTLRSRLQYHINEIGLSIDANAFTFYDAESGMEVPADAKFDVTLGKIDYLADADLGGGCVETFYFNVKVTKRPSISVAEVAGGVHGQTSYKGREDGSMQVRAFNGNAPYILKVYDANGKVVYTAGAAADDYTFAVAGLKAGTYSAAVTDGKGFVASSGTLTIVDPADMVISINGAAAQCKYQPLTLSAEVSGRDAGNLQYVWRKDGVDVSTSQTYTEGSFEEGATYTLFVCDGGGQEVATKAVAAVPTPKIEVVKPDTGCREFFLPKDYQSAFAAYQEHVTYPDSIIGILGAQEVSGDPDIDEADLVLTYYTPKNGDQAQMNIDKIEKSQDLIVRVTAGGLCYHQDTTQVIVKSFQDCYPIVIPAFFSPDDNGINDIFKIAGISDWHYESESPEIVVFDRYGKKVYSGNYDDIKAGWDGKCDGKDLPSGDYWYELTYKTIKPKVGHFTLKRRKE